MTLVFQSGTVLLAIVNLRRLQAKTKTDVLDELLYAEMIWIRMPAQRQKSKDVLTMTSQSAQKDRGCTPNSTRKTVQ